MSELRNRWLLAEKLPDAWMREYIRDGLIRDGFRLGAKTLAEILICVDHVATPEQISEIEASSRDNSEPLDVIVRRVLVLKPSLQKCQRCSHGVIEENVEFCSGCHRYCCISCLPRSDARCIGCSLRGPWTRGNSYTSGWGGQ